MKIFLAVFLCLFFVFNVFAQADSSEDNEKNGVEEISLTRDDGSGKPGEAASLFMTTDVPIHCIVQLGSAKSVLVKMNFVAVKVSNLKAESKIVSVNYKTNGKHNIVNFTASPETIWAAGAYRIDILIDGKFAKSLEFEIKKSPKEMSKEKQLLPKIKPPLKTKQNSPKTRRTSFTLHQCKT
jgi:hypothetical protein